MIKYEEYTRERTAHWDLVAKNWDRFGRLGGYYHRRLHEVYSFFIPPGKKILNVGCGSGELFRVLRPGRAVGVDFSAGMLDLAGNNYPQAEYIQADVHELNLDEQFDYIVMSDLVNDLFDVQTAFERLRKLCHCKTRLILNFYSFFWQTPLNVASRFGLRKPTLTQNWLEPGDVRDLLNLAGFSVLNHLREIILPFDIPLLAPFMNRFLVKLWPFKYLALTNVIVAAPDIIPDPSFEPSVTVVVPARNEAGNIPEIFTRTPRMGKKTELVFVEGHSDDDTLKAIEEQIRAHPEWEARCFVQPGRGKGDAVRLGFEKAAGDILIILDADLTVPPEYLPRFYEVLRSGRADFANGVRLVYPMEKEAMRFFNLLGNKFFSRAFSWLLGQSVKDTLCGTKVLWKKDYESIADNRAYFGDFDPFGDFDLLFGAARLGFRILDVPVRYMDRTYGTTNIRRWKHGLLLLRMVMFAAGRIKFV